MATGQPDVQVWRNTTTGAVRIGINSRRFSWQLTGEEALGFWVRYQVCSDRAAFVNAWADAKERDILAAAGEGEMGD